MTASLTVATTWSTVPLAGFTLLHPPGPAGRPQDLFSPDLSLTAPRAPWPGLQAALQAAAQHFPPSEVLSVRHHDLHVERHPIQPAPTPPERPERWRSQDAPRHADLPPALTGFPTERLWPRTGETLGPIPTAFVPVRLPGQVDQAVGRALTFDRAQSVAMLEALERRASAEPPRQVRRHASYLERSSETATLDPATMILPRPGAPGHVPYHPDLPLDWTNGLSMRRAQPVSVPARLACLNYQRDAPFVHDTSNGYALGRSPTEARLHALLEVIERDAFLMTWYARQSPIPLNLELGAPRPVQHLADACARQGYELRAYRTTQESGVPSVWVTARARRAGVPHVHALAGAHLDPWQAVLAGALEVSTSIFLNARLHDLTAGARCLRHDHEVRTPRDHFNLYAHPASAPRLKFLDTLDPQPVAQAFAGDFQAGGLTPTQALDTLTATLLARHDDVIFVDLTTPPLRRHGWFCVRALVPGLLPLSFGHRARRTQGCVRLERAWAATGQTERAHTSAGDRCSSPHPFG